MTKKQLNRPTKLTGYTFGPMASVCALIVLAAGACSSGNPETDPVPVPDFNLAGTWEWHYDRYNMVSPCLLQIWREENVWRGWFIQHPNSTHACLNRDKRLARVDISGRRVSLGFSPGTTGGPMVPISYRFEIASTSRLEGHVRGRAAAKITLVRKNNIPVQR